MLGAPGAVVGVHPLEPMAAVRLAIGCVEDCVTRKPSALKSVQGPPDCELADLEAEEFATEYVSAADAVDVVFAKGPTPANQRPATITMMMMTIAATAPNAMSEDRRCGGTAAGPSVEGGIVELDMVACDGALGPDIGIANRHLPQEGSGEGPMDLVSILCVGR